MFYQLPPVGNPIQYSVSDQPDAFLTPFFSPYKPRYFASGTAALAAAMIAAVRMKKVDRPEVILPAYGCPDLVSAAVFAGARPVLVDLEADRPWMNLQQLATKISANTVAIVAVHLFGILERMSDLRRLAEQAGAVLIEDSAQAFPGGREQAIWTGDLVVLSFGRGKPVSLLGGGAVLCHAAVADGFLPRHSGQSQDQQRPSFALGLKLALYNWMISPRLYWLPQALPFLHLGETRFHKLHAIEALEPGRRAILPANIVAYQDDDMATQTALVTMLSKLDLAESGIIDLAAESLLSEHRRLLRYPLLVDETVRNRLYAALRRAGVGASVMYPVVLPQIPGLEKILAAQGHFPAAESFAARILTLPTHASVAPGDIENIRQQLISG